MKSLLASIPPSVRQIDLLAPPFSGHLHPVLALGRALAPQYEVRIISTQGALSRITGAGLQGIALPGNFDLPLQEIANPNYAVKSHPVKLYRQFKQAVGLLADFARELDELYQQGQPPDLIIADFTLPVVGKVADTWNIPWWTSLPSPCVLETDDGPPAYCGGLTPATSRWQRFRHAVARKKVRWFKQTIFWLFYRTIRQTGITRLYRPDGTESAYSAQCILALGDKSLEFTRSWPASVQFIGPALYTPPDAGHKPHFVPGQRYILVTLGTHLAWHKEEVADAVLQLARTLPDWQFHFTEGAPESMRYQQTENVVRLPWVNYETCLQYYDLVIHHGGAGIMYYCLRQNIPTLVYPVDFDQFDHAARLEVAGKGVWLKGGLSALINARATIEQLLANAKS
ncbi:glycosyltransferase [uncultured Cedecea sp.]|uniref:glycosyltransferase n=1 Tax=uncultured Cedecea sp. TaxID=988762 RepID=UPI00262CBDDE|nr:glycosyltransferase [uncultured Cedecea sp.]